MLVLLIFSAENAVAIARNGGIDAVVLALKNHRDNANVQQNGCRAIGQFAYKNGFLYPIFTA